MTFALTRGDTRTGRRLAILAAVVFGLVGAGIVGLWVYVDRSRGLPRDPEIRRLADALAAAPTPEDAEGSVEDCVAIRFSNGEWVCCVGINSHSWKRARDTIVVRDSRGQRRVFIGHVCGPRFMDGYARPQLSLDGFYSELATGGFTELAWNAAQ